MRRSPNGCYKNAGFFFGYSCPFTAAKTSSFRVWRAPSMSQLFSFPPRPGPFPSTYPRPYSAFGTLESPLKRPLSVFSISSGGLGSCSFPSAGISRTEPVPSYEQLSVAPGPSFLVFPIPAAFIKMWLSNDPFPKRQRGPLTDRSLLFERKQVFPLGGRPCLPILLGPCNFRCCGFSRDQQKCWTVGRSRLTRPPTNLPFLHPRNGGISNFWAKAT